MILLRRTSVIVALVLLTSASMAYAEGTWILSFPDKATCEAFKQKGQVPGFAEWKAERDTGKGSNAPHIHMRAR